MNAAVFALKLAGFLKALLVPLAYFFGRLSGKKEIIAELDAKNAEMQKKYAEIATQGTTDADTDKALDEGTI